MRGDDDMGRSLTARAPERVTTFARMPPSVRLGVHEVAGLARCRDAGRAVGGGFVAVANAGVGAAARQAMVASTGASPLARRCVTFMLAKSSHFSRCCNSLLSQGFSQAATAAADPSPVGGT